MPNGPARQNSSTSLCAHTAPKVMGRVRHLWTPIIIEGDYGWDSDRRHLGQPVLNPDNNIFHAGILGVMAIIRRMTTEPLGCCITATAMTIERT